MATPQTSLDSSYPARHENCKQLLWHMGVMGQGCKVAVIDTGFDAAWLFSNGFKQLPKVHVHDLTPAREGPVDASAAHHGSTVVGKILMDAPLAEIHSLRVYGHDHSPTREELASAFRWCGESGMQVANLSTCFYGDACSTEKPCALCRAVTQSLWRATFLPCS